jgi:hypothetical protein
VRPSDLFRFCSHLITFTQLAEQTGSRSTNGLCFIICGFARGPLAASAATYISALPYTTPGNTIRNIEAPARAVNQTRPLRPDMVFFRAVLSTCSPKFNASLRKYGVRVTSAEECYEAEGCCFDGTELGRCRECQRVDSGVCMRSTYAALLKSSILTSLQSVSQTLRSSAGSLTASLIDCHLTSDTADLSCTLLRRVLTALIHHCNSSEQFSVVASLVIDRFCILSQAEDVNFSVPCKSRLWSVLFVKGLDYIVCPHCFYALR